MKNIIFLCSLLLSWSYLSADVLPFLNENTVYQKLILRESDLSRDLSLFSQSALLAATFQKLNKIKGTVYLINLKGRAPESFFPELTDIDGDLIITGCENLDNIVFPHLKQITGSLVIQNNNSLESFSFPRLKECGDLIISDLPVLSAWEFPVLQSTGTIRVSRLKRITGMEFPGLENILGSFYFEDCTEAVRLSFPVLGNIGMNLSLLRSTGIFSFPRLSRAGALDIRGLSTESLSFPQLKRIDMNLDFIRNNADKITIEKLEYIGGTFISRANTATSLNIPELAFIGSEWTLADNQNLETLHFPRKIQLGNDNSADFYCLENGLKAQQVTDLILVLKKSDWTGKTLNGIP